MHEMSLMADLLRKVNEIAGKEAGATVTGLRVKLGAFAHISPDHFREHWEQATAEGPLARAKLEVWLNDDQAAPDAADIVLESVSVED